ncbi:ferrous iron transport protein A [Anaerosalibacter bizertensis]|uniref:Ferrous iron transport protein A n=1 Tax=Anaerosalibacter bizertensis TaxID=932217 RepID=A0A844FES9_9FIRM|nr:FeoA family protein [Anaerosalibacter bizertensis]MBU5292868.1 ferrous iron transport protein A [Anaerosalibacter bizertensis]MSS42503.1 ferrous iron transport protein A [Anaerosalibacter bizertensis]
MKILANLEKGFEGTIVEIKTDRDDIIRKLMAMGVFPGSSVKVIQTFPSYVFQVGYTQVAVDKEIARTIVVE